MKEQENKKAIPSFSEMESDFEKYPLPICFDPQEEQRQLWKRTQKIKVDREKMIEEANYYSSHPQIILRIENR